MYPAKRQSFTNLMHSVDNCALDIASGIARIKRLDSNANVTDKDLLNMLGALNASIVIWQTAANEPNFQAFIAAEKNDRNLDLNAEMRELVSTATAMKNWIDANIRSERNRTPSHTYDEDGKPTAAKSDRTKVAEFIILCNAYLANVDLA